MVRIAGGILLAVVVLVVAAIATHALAPKYVLEWYDTGMTPGYSQVLHNTLVAVGSTLPADPPRAAAWRPVSDVRMGYNECLLAREHYEGEKISQTGTTPLVRCVRAR